MENETLGLIKAAHASGGSLCTPVGEFRKADLEQAFEKAEEQARDELGRFASTSGGNESHHRAKAAEHEAAAAETKDWETKRAHITAGNAHLSAAKRLRDAKGTVRSIRAGASEGARRSLEAQHKEAEHFAVMAAEHEAKVKKS